MSRRKQARPRLWKREEEDEVNLETLGLNVVYEINSVEANEHLGKEDKYLDENLSQYSTEYVPKNLEINDDDHMTQFLLDEENSLDSDTLGTEGGSSWVSEDHTTSASSSCATPNSTNEAPDTELSFTGVVTDSTTHSCRFCDKSFPKQSHLKKHEQTHVDCMPFRCEYCRRIFKHKRSRDRHIKLHTGDRKYKCSQCDAAFSRSDHLKIHTKTHDHHKPFQCTVCNRGYNTAAALTSHMQNHKRSSENSSNPSSSGMTFKCLQCSEIFRKPEELQKHMSSHQQSDPLSDANGCSKSPSPYALVRLTCAYCTKDNFSTVEALQTHVRSVHKSIVHGELTSNNRCTSPQLGSDSCVASAPTTSSPSHMPQSTNSLPSYCCELCTKRFASVPALHKHTDAMHRSSSTNPFSTLKYLKTPELVNNGKLYCVYCATDFLTPASFAEHYVVFHGSYHSFHQLLGLIPPAQMKPTDLTVGKKTSPIRRSAQDEYMLPKKKYKNSESENSCSANCTAPSSKSDFICQQHRYDYTGPLLCNQCLAAFTDFESFRAHIKLHIEETSGGLSGNAASVEKCEPPSTDYVCPHCRSVFSSTQEISQHIATHLLATNTAQSCENCHRSFTKTDELQKHMMDVHARILYSCSICNEVFDSKVTIQAHFSSRHVNTTKVYRCIGCPTTTSANIYHSESGFAEHVKSVHATASNSSALNSHNMHHSATILTCSICHINFSSELDMQLHLATHGRQFQCTVCPSFFHIEYLLDKHMQSHHSPALNGKCCEDTIRTDPSPAQSPGSRFDSPVKKMENGAETKDNFTYCVICGKTEFLSEGDLMAHTKIHHKMPSSAGQLMNNVNENGDKHVELLLKQKTISSICASPANVPFDFGKKNETFNGDVGVSNDATSCEKCEKRDFTTEHELQSHRKLIHHVKLPSPGKTNLHCTYCNESCKSRNDLEKHVKSHSQNSTTSGKHKCIICDEMCPTATVLAEHKLTHCKVLASKTCMHCKGCITTEEQFYSHIQQHGSTNCNNVNRNKNGGDASQLRLPTVCVICRQTLISETEARMHARFHLQQFTDLVPCSACLQMFDRRDLIIGICRECYQRHGKSSSFRCPECHMKFDTGTNTEIHLATVHRKNYQCIKCQVNFDNEKEIRAHVATHTMVDELNGHECRLCRLILPTKLLLQAHLIEHNFAKCTTFACYLCQSVFATAQGLQTHILEHGLEARPYDCARCKDKFFFTSELEHHNYMHLEEVTVNEDQNYKYHKKSSSKEKLHSTTYQSHSSTVETTETFSSEISHKYSCSECKVEFHHANEFYEHKSHLHKQNGRFSVKDGELQPSQILDKRENLDQTVYKEGDNMSAANIKFEYTPQYECESEEEQIDVVSTKVDNANKEQNNKVE